MSKPSKRAAASIGLHRIQYPTRAIDVYFIYLTGARFEKFKEYSSGFREFSFDSEQDKNYNTKWLAIPSQFIVLANLYGWSGIYIQK